MCASRSSWGRGSPGHGDAKCIAGTLLAVVAALVCAVQLSDLELVFFGGLGMVWYMSSVGSYVTRILVPWVCW